MLRARYLLSLTALTVLAACGGGDVDVLPDPPPPARPQGIWNGSTGAGSDLRLLITDEHVIWGLYQPVGSTQVGFFHAPRLTLTGQQITATLRDYAPGNTVGNGQLTATVINRASMRGQTVDAGRNVNFQADYDTGFETQASNTALEGTWAGNDRDGNPVTLQITNTGAFSGTTTPTGGTVACTFGGNATHRAGRGYYEVSITFANSNACLLPGQTVTGVGQRWQSATDVFLGSTLLTSGGDQGVAAVLKRQPVVPTTPTTPGTSGTAPTPAS